MAAKVFVLTQTAVGRNKEMVTALKQPEGLKVRREDIREKRNLPF